MNLIANYLKKLVLSLFLGISSIAMGQVNSYEINDLGYLRSPKETTSGIVLTNNRFSEIYLLKNDQLTTLVKGRGCGIYTQLNHDKSLVGFKSIDENYFKLRQYLRSKQVKLLFSKIIAISVDKYRLPTMERWLIQWVTT